MKKLILSLLALAFLALPLEARRRFVPPPAAAPGTPAFLTSQTTVTLRSDFAGELGFRLTVGASNINVTGIGRWVVSGNSGSHALRICDASGVTMASATLNTSGKPTGAYSYETISVTLTAGEIYYVFSTEALAGDQWYDEGAVATTAVATVDGSAFAVVPGNPMLAGAGLKSFVPVNFTYTL